MSKMTPGDIFHVFRRRAALLLLIPFVAMLLAGAYYWLFAVDIFTAETSLFVLVSYRDSQDNLRYDTSTSNNLAGDYRELFALSGVLEETARKLGVPGLEKQVRMKMESLSGTRILLVTATGRDAALCASAANTAAELFAEYMLSLTKVEGVSIAKRAITPQTPSGPARLRNTCLAGAAAFFLCAVIAVASEAFNTRVKSDMDIVETCGLPLLARIPEYRREMEAFFRRSHRDGTTLYACASGQTRESVKTLAVNIQFASVDRPARRFAITSATLGEGKSSVAVMTACAIAEEGKSVLVVDMDFRHPSVGSLFGRRGALDLLDYLTGKATLSEIVCDTGNRRVFFVDSRHEMASLPRLVQTEAFETFVRKVSEAFDFVIFDAPPLGLFIDAAVLASKLDGAVLAVAQNRAETRQVRAVAEQLVKSNAVILGAALTFVAPQKQSRYASAGREPRVRAMRKGRMA